MRENKIAVLCPSKNRLENCIRLSESYKQHSSSQYSDLYFVIDDDNTECYSTLQENKIIVPVGRRGIVDPMNRAMPQIQNKYTSIFFMGDDHVFRTQNWDKVFLECIDQLGGVAVVYGNDLHQRHKLASSCLMTTNIIDVLGHIYDPSFNHMWTDNYWMSIGQALNRLIYREDIIIEHMHPGAKKSKMDANYHAVTALTEQDSGAWSNWITNTIDSTIEKIKKELKL